MWSDSIPSSFTRQILCAPSIALWQKWCVSNTAATLISSLTPLILPIFSSDFLLGPIKCSLCVNKLIFISLVRARRLFPLRFKHVWCSTGVDSSTCFSLFCWSADSNGESTHGRKKALFLPQWSFFCYSPQNVFLGKCLRHTLPDPAWLYSIVPEELKCIKCIIDNGIQYEEEVA